MEGLKLSQTPPSAGLGKPPIILTWTTWSRFLRPAAPPRPPPLSYKTPRSFRHLASSITQHKFSANTPLSNYASVPANNWSRGLVPGFHTDIHPTQLHSSSTPPPPPIFCANEPDCRLPCPGILVPIGFRRCKTFSNSRRKQGRPVDKNRGKWHFITWSSAKMWLYILISIYAKVVTQVVVVFCCRQKQLFYCRI